MGDILKVVPTCFTVKKSGDSITYLVMEFLKEFNLIHQRFNLPFQLQTGQCSIIHILVIFREKSINKLKIAKEIKS